VSIVATLSEQKAAEGLCFVARSSDINGTISADTLVQKNCSLHIRGNLLANLTIESGAKVVVEGSVEGKIVNKGGRLLVNNKAHASCITTNGPAEAEARGILKIDLTAIVSNWERLAKFSTVECAAGLEGNAYGCGIEPIAGALARNGCKTFFVSDIPEARRVRAVAQNAAIYVLGGLYSGTRDAFADVDAQPVIYSPIEMAEWDLFTGSQGWSGGCALHVDTGKSRRGLSVEEAVAFAPSFRNHGVTLLISRLDSLEKTAKAANDQQIALFNEVRRLYKGVSASMANASAIFVEPKAHCDLIRADAALYGVNPTAGANNPMLPVIELQARIVQIVRLAPGETIADANGWTAKRPTRLALVSAGYADGYPRCERGSDKKLHAIVGDRPCPIVGQPSMDLLAIDVTEVSDPTVVRHGNMVTLIGPETGIDELAVANKSTGCEVLSHLGQRFHRIYHVT
jgi:alanine racemase